MDMASVSVVLASYNGEKYIERQLLSLLYQTRPAEEVIICDDGSSDGTAEIAERFIKEHQCKGWCFLRYGENVGFVKNFKRAMEKSTGDIVFLCDQDDIWCEEKIEIMTEFMENHPEVTVLCTALSPIDADGNEIRSECPHGTANLGLVKRILKTGEAVKIRLSECMRCNVSAGCTMALRRSVVTEYTKKSNLLIPHDQELNLLAAERHSLVFLNLPLTWYRLHGENTLGFNKRVQTRADIAREKYEFATALSRYGVDNSDMFGRRADALAAKKPLKAAGFILKKSYRCFFNFREYLGDILYCLR